MDFIRPFLVEIKTLCERYNVSRLGLIGLAARNTMVKGSDVDLMVDFSTKDPLVYSDLYFTLKQEFEELLNTQVDLIEYRALRNSRFMLGIEREEVVVYVE